LYALTSVGGINGGGTIVKMNPDGSGFSKVYDFIYDTGSLPVGNLLQTSNGKLYGACYDGGIWGSCVIFSYDPSDNSYSDLFDFEGPEGDFPLSGLIEAPNGKLYGVTSDGGKDGAGVIYSFDPSDNTYTDLYELEMVNGSAPVGS